MCYRDIYPVRSSVHVFAKLVKISVINLRTKKELHNIAKIILKLISNLYFLQIFKRQ